MGGVVPAVQPRKFEIATADEWNHAALKCAPSDLGEALNFLDKHPDQILKIVAPLGRELNKLRHAHQKANRRYMKISVRCGRGFILLRRVGEL